MTNLIIFLVAVILVIILGSKTKTNINHWDVKFYTIAYKVK